ncbi:MAG TPA: hypothetical protein VML55_21560 [Planctomycetaceae bacterium]|nr:hypothetical protein [Planctomycetaceae bacterium]
MARKTASRLQKRREIEAAAGTETAADAKKAAPKRKPAKRASRAKDKPTQRKRLVWAVLSGSMKEEARFPYDQRQAAEDKLELLRSKSKKLYFIQPVKELITDAPLPVSAVKAAPVKAAKAARPARPAKVAAAVDVEDEPEAGGEEE